MHAHPSVPAARAYLAAQKPAYVHYNGKRSVRKGYQLYFTVVLPGAASAVRLKVCEDVRGRVTGSSNISNSEVSC